MSVDARSRVHYLEHSMHHRIHILGASGSGTSTLGAALAGKLGCCHYDSDDYFWVPTDPPYEKVREVTERTQLLLDDLRAVDHWILSGSLCGWGDAAIEMFDLVVFLQIPHDLRMKRLKNREDERYGPCIHNPNTPAGRKSIEFIEWASKYDTAGLELRSLVTHEAWLEKLPCSTLRIEGDTSTEERLNLILHQTGRTSRR